MASEQPKPTVLVVEDDILIRMDLAGCLSEAGFLVIEAMNADQAIVILETREDIRLVCTDVDMPGSMDDLKLAAAVRDRWPPIKIIVASGLGTVDETHVPPGGRFYRKPYRQEHIVQAVRELIQA